MGNNGRNKQRKQKIKLAWSIDWIVGKSEKPYSYYSQEERFQSLVKKYSGLEK